MESDDIIEILEYYLQESLDTVKLPSGDGGDGTFIPWQPLRVVKKTSVVDDVRRALR